MKIVSWNIASNNQEGNIDKFFEAYKADIYCLQEVSLPLLTFIRRKLPEYYTLVSHDFIQYSKTYYLVTLLKNTIKVVDTNEFSLNGQKKSAIQHFLDWDEARTFHFAECVINGKTIAVCNVHLTNGCPPTQRSLELATIFSKLEQYNKAIIAGDFNTFGVLPLNLFVGSIYGYGFKDLFINEKEAVEGIMKQYKYRDCMPYGATHKFLTMKRKLDYIVGANSLAVKQSSIGDNSFGSDHFPIEVEFVI